MWSKILEFFASLFGAKVTAPEIPVTPVPAPVPEIPKVPAPVVDRLPVLSVAGTVKPGQTGRDVTVVQNRVKELGYDPGAIDGDYGPQTTRAVKSFQQDKGLVADGVAGGVTLERMGIKIDAPPVVVPDGKANPYKKGSAGWYAFEFSRLTYDPGFELKIANQAKKLYSNKARYEKVAASLNIPWWFIAALHSLEASGNFAGVLCNGEKIIGTGRKTVLVPKGRGPFETWEASAIDEMTRKGLNKNSDWSLGNALRLAELYNGAGYLTGGASKNTIGNAPGVVGENSPYVWSMTSVNDNYGKYVADGKFDPRASSNGQVGVAAILREFQKTFGVSLS